MFGLGKSKTQKMVEKLERRMIATEDAYKAGKLDVARHGSTEELKIMRWLNMEGEWSEREIDDFLRNRGLVQRVNDGNFHERMSEDMIGL